MKTHSFKRILFCIALMLFFFPAATLAGGPEFKELNKIKLPFTPSTHWYTHTDDFKFFLCSTKSDMLMLDGISSKILWQTNFKKDYKNEKFSNQFWNKEANVVLVYDEDNKKGIAMKYFIDGNSGKILWSSDKYVSDLGDYELSDGFSNYYDSGTNSVLLPTKESVELVDVNSGKILWSKPITLTGKAKDFDCFIMKYHDLVKIITDKESEIYLTTTEGKEIKDIEPYFNKKKYLSDRKHATVINIPEKNMYVIMQGETSKAWSFLGAMQGMSADIPQHKMNFIAYEEDSNKELWRKQYKISFLFDAIDFSPYVRLDYADGKLIVQHDPMVKLNDGLTVLDINTGDKLWQASYSCLEMKSSLSKTYFTPFPSPSPVLINGNLFVVDKLRNTVRCYDAQNGNLIWESKKYPDAQKIPALVVTDGVVIMVHGSPAIKIVRIEDKSSSRTRIIFKREYLSKDKYGIIAYDAATGKEKWSGESISKMAKDKFDYISGTEFIDGKLYCATDKNFFILDPKNGDVVNGVPVSKEKLGDAWNMQYFEKQKKIILNCEDGIVKIDPIAAKVEGTLKTKTIPYYPATIEMNADDLYSDYALFTDGNAAEGKFKEFAAIDLDKMSIRGLEDGELLFYDIPHFSYGGEMFYKVDGEEIRFFSVK